MKRQLASHTPTSHPVCRQLPRQLFATSALLAAMTPAWGITVANEDDLRTAIFNLNSGDVITLGGTITLTQSLPMITADVTVDGAGYLIDANNVGRVFFVQAGTATIRNVRIFNALAQGGHGGAGSSLSASSLGAGGGGGLGAGAALFVNTGATALVDGLQVVNAAALGGDGGSVTLGANARGSGGGGGLGGPGGGGRNSNGGGGYAGAGGWGQIGSGGGGGEFGRGGAGGAGFALPTGGGGGGRVASGSAGDSSGAGGAVGGGDGGIVGSNGSFHGGGGGGGDGPGGRGGVGGGGGGAKNDNGGAGGAFGGGGGAGNARDLVGGAGGLGGGGGGAEGGSNRGVGGRGGLGAGGGGGHTGGLGGLHGGTGGADSGLAGTGAGGGGGGALGGAVFVAPGGELTLSASRFSGSFSVTAGAGGSGGDSNVTTDDGTAGQALGRLIYVSGSGGAAMLDVPAGDTSSLDTGALAGAGALTKTGVGTLEIAGANSNYSGTLAINSGTLAGGGSVGGRIELATGTRLSPGSSGGAGVGTLAANELQLAAGAGLSMQLGTSSDRVDVVGDLTVTGTVTVDVAAGAGFSAGTYRVANYGGTLNGTLTVGTLPAGYTATLSTATANQMDLVVSVATYNISVNPGAGGAVSCTPNPVPHGANATCTAVASAGYDFTGWAGDCGGAVATCTLNNVTAARTVTASFASNDPGPSGPTETPITSPAVVTITEPSLPIYVAPGAGGATIVLPGTGSTPVNLQITVNGQQMSVSALPGTQLQVTRVNGQDLLVLVVLQGAASMASTAAGQPMALAGPVLLSSGAAGTRIDAQPLAVAVVSGSLMPQQGTLPELGTKGLLAGERLQVDVQGRLTSITLGSIRGDGEQVGDAMVFANLPSAITVDGKAFARLEGSVARLAGANLVQGLEIAPSGVLMVRDGGQIFQLLATLPITVDATQPDGLSFTPLGQLRWVRNGVVVQFAPAVADLTGLTTAVTAALPGAALRLGAEGVLQLIFDGTTYVLKPDWTGAGTATGIPRIGVDVQGRIVLQNGSGASQMLVPALLNIAQAHGIFSTAIPGSMLAVQPGSSEGALTLTLSGQTLRLVPQWALPVGAAGKTEPWRMGPEGVLYLKLGTQVQGVRIAD